MITEEDDALIESMKKEAAELESKCATKKPEKLPRHELALYLMDNHFKGGQVPVGLSLVIAFVVVELLATL